MREPAQVVPPFPSRRAWAQEHPLHHVNSNVKSWRGPPCKTRLRRGSFALAQERNLANKCGLHFTLHAAINLLFWSQPYLCTRPPLATTHYSLAGSLRIHRIASLALLCTQICSDLLPQSTAIPLPWSQTANDMSDMSDCALPQSRRPVRLCSNSRLNPCPLQMISRQASPSRSQRLGT